MIFIIILIVITLLILVAFKPWLRFVKYINTDDDDEECVGDEIRYNILTRKYIYCVCDHYGILLTYTIPKEELKEYLDEI